ncbi:MAG: hypothetical protein U0984_07600 [Prosthecobacter sp.]|nr:hypothetical protein [Prosthecobacter sp.]
MELLTDEFCNQTSMALVLAPKTGGLFATVVKAKDQPQFYALQVRNQERVKRLLEAFEIIRAAPTLQIGYDEACAKVGDGQRGFSPGNLRTLYTAFYGTRDCGGSRDWRCLVDQALEFKPGQQMPQAFIDYIQEAVDLNKRSVQMALKKVRAEWTNGKKIPGYGTWQEHWMRRHPGKAPPKTCPEHPLGWSTENLRRKLDSSKYRRAALVLGRGAAAKYRPLVLGTRAGLHVGSHYMYDDVWHDNFVNSFAEKKAGRPLELFTHDYFSARKVRYGIRVRTEGDNGKMNGLTARMMRMLVAATFYLDGYSPKGTENVAEHGTAAFDEHMEKVLYDASGGLITVNRSGMQGDAAHLGQYNGRRTGNWRFKASLESSNNIVHNLLADLPGQTGPSVERRPEELHGLLQYNSRVLAAMQQLPADRAALLQYPLLEVNQFLPVLSEVYAFLENDHEHDLEGWEACGHFTQDIFILGHWRTADELMQLTGAEREMAMALLTSGKLQTRPRKLSRREVWDRGAGDLIRIHGGTVCDLLGEDFAEERKVKGHQFAFEDKEVGPGEHRFEGFITDATGKQYALEDGESYQAFINPFAPDQLFVRDAKGRFLGIAKRTEKVTRGDMEALARAMGHAKHVEAELVAPLVKRQAKAANLKLAMHRHNAGVLQDAASDEEDLTQGASDAMTAAVRARRSAFLQSVGSEGSNGSGFQGNNNDSDTNEHDNTNTTDESGADW